MDETKRARSGFDTFFVSEWDSTNLDAKFA
jgi:hypothetical protein